MKTRSILSTGISRLLFLTVLGAAPSAWSATKIWDGGPGGAGIDFATPANWDLDTLPVANDTLQWNGTAAGNLALTLTNITAFQAGTLGYTIDVTAAQTGSLRIDNVTTNTGTNALRLNAVTIASGAGAFTLGDGSGTSVVTLGGSGNTANTWTNNSANAATLSSDLIWADGNAQANRQLTLTGTGNWNMNAVYGVTVAAGTGSLGLTKTGAGTLTLSAANTYTGTTTLTGGRMVLAHTGALGASTQLNFGNVAGTILEIATDSPVTNPIPTNSGTGFAPTIILNRGTPGAAYTQTLGAATYGGGTVNVQAGANVTSGTPTLNYTSLGLTSGTAGSTLLFNPTIANVIINSASITGTANAKNLGLGGTSTGNFVTGPITNGLAGSTLSVVKTNTSTWTLNGANSYTGTTTVSGGTLITTPAHTGATTVTVADGATLGVKLATAGTTFNVTTLNTGTTTGATLLFDTSTVGNPTVPMISAAAFTPVAPTLLRVTGSALSVGNNIPLLDYAGAIGGVGFAGLSLALPARTVGNLVDNTTNTRVDLNITALEQVRWTGTVNANWDADTDGSGTNGTQNWVTTVLNTPTKYLQGTGGTDTANFDDAGSGNPNVNIAIAVTPAGTNFNNSAVNYTLSSTGGFGIGGTGPLTKSGTGSLTIETANTYSGGTTLNSGTINVKNASALGTGTVTINGGTLDNTTGSALVLTTNNAQTWNGDFTFAGTNELDMGGGTVTLGGAGTDRTVTVNNGTLTVGEIKGPAHGLVLPGSGTLVATSVGGGVDGSVIAGTLNVTGTLQINRTGALAAASGDFTVGGLIGNGTVVNGAAAERWLFVNTNGTPTFNGTLTNGGSGALGLNKLGSGTLTLPGFQSYTGITTVQAGTLAITGALGDTAINVTGGTLSLQNVGAFAPITARALTISGTGVLDQQVDNAIGGAASLVAQKSLTLSRPNSYTGDTTINAGTNTTVTITDPTAAGFGRLAAATGATNAVFALRFDGGGTIAMSNSFGGNSGVVATIDVNNNGSGTNGVIQLNGTGLYGNGTLNVTGGNGYNLAIAGFTNNAGSAGTTVLNPTTANLSLGNYSSSTNFAKTLQLDGTSTGNFVTGVISNGTNVVSLTKANSSTWTLTGANTYTGATTITGGTLQIGDGLTDGSIATASSITNDATLVYNLANSQTVANVISGTGSLTKLGAGSTLTLTGVNSYTGATNVNAGTLITTPAQTGATAVNVANDATFGVKLATAGTTFNVGTLTTGTTTNATLILDTGALGNPTVPVISTTTFTPAASTLLRVTGTALTVGNNIPLLDYTGAIGGLGFAGLSVALPARTAGSLVNNTTDTRVDLNITGLEQVKWKGNVNGDWDIDPDGTGTLGTQNWVTTVLNTPTKYLQGTGGTDAVNFDDSATGTSVVNLTTTLTPFSILVNNTTAGVPTYTFTGPGTLSGAGGLAKQGNGTLIFANSAAYDYTGGTTISGGTLQIGDGVTSGLGFLPSGTITNNATLALSVPDEFTIAQPIDGTGTIVKNNTNTATFSTAATNAHNYTLNDGKLRFTAGGTLSGVINGTGEFEAGGGTLQLAGTTANTNSGLTTVSAGTLQLNKTAGVNAVGGDVVITGSGVLAILANEQIPDTATVTFTGTSTDSTVGTTGTETIANLIVNPISAAGQFQLRNNFTVSGTATLNQGVLGVSSGHTATLNAVNMSGGILRIAGNSAASTLNIGAGGITASGGEIQVKFNTNNQDGVLNLGGNFTATGDVSITDAGYNGANLHIINLVGGPRTFDIAATTTTTVSPDIGDGILVKAGDGTLVLNGDLGTTGAFTLTANGGATTINESQTIAALNIGGGATVILGEDLTPAPGLEGALADPGLGADVGGFDGVGAASSFGDPSQVSAVPEPGSLALLIFGALGLCRRRRV